LGNLPSVLVVAPSKNIRTVQDLVALGKQRAITFGVIGVGSPIYLTMERFRLSAGFQGQPIPFRGAPEALTEVMTGRVDVYYSPVLAALPFIRSGQLLPLAVSSSKRTSILPDVPTTLEAGYPDSEYNFWIGVFAPAKTPPAIVGRLNRDISNVLRDPAVREKLAKLGVEPMEMTADEFNAFVRKELVLNANLAKAAGISPR
jgi:tripartite-type tricarboxylate transporter receptor subunit TctC